MSRESKAFEFGLFRLDVRERRLTQDGYTVPLHGKVFDTLHVLVSNHGRLVTKDELIAAVWPDSVVEEANLNHNICILRRALGEKATGQKYIETVPRQGYRFVAEVKELERPEKPSAAHSWKASLDEPPLPETGPSHGIPYPESDLLSETPDLQQKPFTSTHPRRFHHRAFIALALVAGLLAIVYIEVQRFRHAGRLSSSRTMLAVLPFENLTGNPADNHTADGLNEEIISQLGRWNPLRLGVIGRTSSMAYQRSGKSIREIGRELGVDYLVEGSVRREGNRLRITVLLVRVGDQAHLWAANYDGDVSNILNLQVEVSRDIVREIGNRLAVQAGPTSSGSSGSEPNNSTSSQSDSRSIPVECFQNSDSPLLRQLTIGLLTIRNLPIEHPGIEGRYAFASHRVRFLLRAGRPFRTALPEVRALPPPRPIQRHASPSTWQPSLALLANSTGQLHRRLRRSQSCLRAGVA